MSVALLFYYGFWIVLVVVAITLAAIILRRERISTGLFAGISGQWRKTPAGSRVFFILTVIVLIALWWFDFSFSLNEAVWEGNLTAVKIFLALGADPQAIDETSQWTLPEIAVFKRRLDVLEYLVDHGAEVDRALEFAARNNDLEMTRFLVGHQPSAHARKMALEYAVGMETRVELVRLLVEPGGIEINRALAYASMSGKLTVVEYFLSRGGDLNYRADDASYPLILAAEEGQLEMVKYLIEHGADSTLVDRKGRTALAAAKAYRRADVVAYLERISHGGQR